MSDASFTHLFSRALQGHACSVVGVGADPVPLPVHVWSRSVDHSDSHLLTHCLDLRHVLHAVAGKIDEQDRAGRVEGEPVGQRAVEQHGLEPHSRRAEQPLVHRLGIGDDRAKIH